MSLSELIAPELPYLRRFSRSLSGNQASGDAYAAAALQTIVSDPAALDPAVSVRVALYRVFLKVWDSVPLNNGVDAHILSPLERAGHRNLDALTPRARVAFLLQAVEGFTVEQIGEALECSLEEATALIEAAAREIGEQIATDVLIIEDEPIIAMDLEALVKDQGHRVIGIARTHSEALAALAEEKPGLVLADLQLADGSSGLNAVNDILNDYQMPVIFITAYPEQVLTGAAPEPTFLIKKPFRDDQVKAVMSQALFFERNATRADRKRRQN